jgi:hypothetical protein
MDNTANLSGYAGYLVTFAGGNPTLNASTTIPAVGVVADARTRIPLSGGTTYYDNAIGILGGLPGPMRGWVDLGSVALNFGDRVMQAASGGVTKEVTGSARVVVGICTDKNGAQPGDLTEITFFTPLYLTY